MAFELDDQMDDAAFFDQLVNDDDDDGVSVIAVAGSGANASAGLKLTSTTLSSLTESLSVVSNGDVSDDAKAFANLTISEPNLGTSDVNFDNFEVKEDVNFGVKDEVNYDNLEVKEDSNLVGGGGVVDVGEPREEEKEQLVEDGEESGSLDEAGSLSFDNGHVLSQGAATATATATASEGESVLTREGSGSVTGSVKEVQWSAFADPNGSGGFDSDYSDFFSELADGAASGSFQGDVKNVFGVEVSNNIAADGAYVNGAAEDLQSQVKTVYGIEPSVTTATEGAYVHGDCQQENGVVGEQFVNEAAAYDSQHGENLYPGWKYDYNTGQWVQLDAVDGSTSGQMTGNVSGGRMEGSVNKGSDNYWSVSDVQTYQDAHAQQTLQSQGETVRQSSVLQNVSGLSRVSQMNGEYQYPGHFYFDSQYPGWYYDTMAQQWQSLDAYHKSAQSTDQTYSQLGENAYYQGAAQSLNNGVPQGTTSGGLSGSQSTYVNGYYQQNTHAPQSDGMTGSESVNLSKGLSWQSSDDSIASSHSVVGVQTSTNSGESVPSQTNHTYYNQKSVDGHHSFVPNEYSLQQYTHSHQGEQNGPLQYHVDHYPSQNTTSVSQPFFPNGHHVTHASIEGRSSAGRPPHALVSFGFGGKLVVLNDNSVGGYPSFGDKGVDSRSVSVYNLTDIGGVKDSPFSQGAGDSNYFSALCHQSFPGPLLGGSVGAKELNKWIDQRIANRESPDVNFGRGDAQKLLLSLLKIACEHLGKFRSGPNTGLTASELPELAVAKLFASSKRNGVQISGYGASRKCFMNLPSEAQIQATASEVQNLLVSGRRKEALQCALEGQLWEFALILAQDLGDQFYADAVKQMAVSQLAIGSPLRTLCLLIAKKPEEIFSATGTGACNMPTAVHMPPQPVQNAGSSMLDNWEENLAVVVANKTENDTLVMIHLGDCLWKEKNDVTAAHICYLVAEAAFEFYSDSARLCLIGADHLNFPRTYASPEAIQRTEYFEYSKFLGNSQSVVLQLQPYKLIYAHMLAEVGRVSESLKYCQAAHKSLKTARSPETDTLKQMLVSLEERLRIHQQSGYTANLGPAKIMGKLMNLIDSTAHRVVGGLPPPVPSTTQSSIQSHEHQFQTSGPKVSGSRPPMTTPLMPSASMEPISQWAVDGSRMTLENRSVSEPDIGRTPIPDQVDSSNEASSSSTQGNQSDTAGTSRFRRLNFGVQILQKTVGLLKPRTGRQAKLGEENKFYFDEKLNRWVEEGAAPPAEESALPPPPTSAAFQNGVRDYNSNITVTDAARASDGSPESKSIMSSQSSSGIPAMPPSVNQFSARGRMGVRSRYVDTFNKGGAVSTPMFQTPLVPPPAQPAAVASAKFFIPAAPLSNEQTLTQEAGSRDNGSENGKSSSTSINDPFQNLGPSSAGSMQRFPSDNDLSNTETVGSGNDPLKTLEPSSAGTMQRFPSGNGISNTETVGSGNDYLSSQSRRTASWSGMHSGTFVSPTNTEVKASPLSFMPHNHSSSSLHSGSNLGDDLQEVEL